MFVEGRNEWKNGNKIQIKFSRVYSYCALKCTIKIKFHITFALEVNWASSWKIGGVLKGFIPNRKLIAYLRSFTRCMMSKQKVFLRSVPMFRMKHFSVVFIDFWIKTRVKMSSCNEVEVHSLSYVSSRIARALERRDKEFFSCIFSWALRRKLGSVFYDFHRPILYEKFHVLRIEKA